MMTSSVWLCETGCQEASCLMGRDAGYLAVSGRADVSPGVDESVSRSCDL